MEYRYELRVVSNFEYSSHADTGFFYFTNGVSSAFGPSGGSDKKFIGKTVLCRLRKGIDHFGKEGYFFLGLAEVVGFAESGRPNAFGSVIHNRSQGYWEEPDSNDIIYDERKRGKAVEIH